MMTERRITMLPTKRRGWLSLDRPVDVFDELNRMLSKAWLDEGDSGGFGAYPVDIREDDDHVYVDAELPGFTNRDVEVTLENGVLRIAAERQTENKKGQTHLFERRFTRINRAFTLPTTVNEDKVDAKLTDGVLHLTLHKREEVKPRKIAIK